MFSSWAAKTVDVQLPGKLAQVDALRHLVTGDVALAHLEVSGNDAVYRSLYLAYLLLGGAGGEVVVALALLALYVVDARTVASEGAYHRLVQYVLCRVGRRKLLLVVLVEYGRCIHCEDIFAVYRKDTDKRARNIKLT